MNNNEGQQSAKRKFNQADKLKSRLFEKGVGHSSMSSFKSPLTAENRTLIVNLNSSNSSSKFSPKVIRKQVAGFPKQDYIQQKKPYLTMSSNKGKKFASSSDKIGIKQSQFLQQVSRQQKKVHQKTLTSMNFYNKTEVDAVQQRSITIDDNNFSQQFKRTKNLVQKLSGKSHFYEKQEKKSPLSPKRQINQINRQSLSFQQSKSNTDEKQKMTLQSYIQRALKNEPDLQQFLYLVNNPKDKDGSKKDQQDPYELHIVQYQSNKEIEHKLNDKYYTISKKGLCYYINSKPAQFIDLEEWVAEKQNYTKIKNLNFFNRFRKWKTVKMWRKYVLKHRIEECSKSLQQKLFLLNPVIRQCIFQIQEISLQMTKNLVILSSNQDEYSLQNFKAIQQKTKRKVSGIIQEYSKNSRDSVKKCFEQNLRNLRTSMKQKEKQEQQQKIPNISDHINLKDSAFQALDFPPKMSYENRSKLRKMAGKFIRFSYLVDMLHTAGLATYFTTQLNVFISKLQESQTLQNLEVLMTREDVKTNNPNAIEQNIKMFNVKLLLHQKQIPIQSIVAIPFGVNNEGYQIFNPLYHISVTELEHYVPKKRQYCPKICEEWLEMTPPFQQIYEQIIQQIKQSLGCLKYFERWSKHRDMQKFVNILEEWDDVVNESREIAQNQNLDPVSIIVNFQGSLTEIKTIFTKSLQTIKGKIKDIFTEFLNVHWQEQKININIFRNHKLQSAAQTVESFLKYLNSNMQKLDKKIPE